MIQSLGIFRLSCVFRGFQKGLLDGGEVFATWTEVEPEVPNRGQEQPDNEHLRLHSGSRLLCPEGPRT